jgi:two-component system, LuxR family, response regulator FixJ
MPADKVVHVVDDDAAMRDSLQFLLSAAGFDVKLHESAVAFLADAAKVDGCVVTDVRMPEMDGIELLRRLKVSSPQLPVIVMTGHGDVPLAVEAMKLGASDFVEKPFDDETLLGAIKAALEQSHAIAAGTVDPEIATRTNSLSERERQVFEGLVAGQSNKVIANKLKISPRTVEIYRANVMTKMQAGSLSELVRFAIRAGFGV